MAVHQGAAAHTLGIIALQDNISPGYLLKAHICSLLRGIFIFLPALGGELGGIQCMHAEVYCSRACVNQRNCTVHSDILKLYNACRATALVIYISRKEVPLITHYLIQPQSL
ncbi:WNK lysine deficient protein kinase [Sarotherodon galilaeus]